MEVLRWAYRVPFLSEPPLAAEPIPFPSYGPSSIKGIALGKEVQSLLEKGAVELAPLPFPGFYSRIFVVMKASGSWRPVIDLSTLNLRVHKTPFKMETLQSVRSGDWMVSIDLKDAYLQIPIHPDSHKYLRFVALNQVFQFKALCFGLSTAPQVFTRVMAPVSVLLHRLASPGILSVSGSPGIGDGSPTVPGTGDCSQLGEVQPYSIPESGVPRGDSRFHSFQGFSLPTESREAMLNRQRIPVLRQAARFFVEKAARNSIFPDVHHSRGKVTNAVPSASAPSSVGPDGRFHLDSVGSGMLTGSGLVDEIRSPSVGHLSGSGQPSPQLLVRCLGRGLGGSSSGCYRFRPMVSGGSSAIDQCQGVACSGVRPALIPTSSVQLHGGGFCGQLHSSSLSANKGVLDLRSSTLLRRGSYAGRNRSI